MNRHSKKPQNQPGVFGSLLQRLKSALGGESSSPVPASTSTDEAVVSESPTETAIRPIRPISPTDHPFDGFTWSGRAPEDSTPADSATSAQAAPPTPPAPPAGVASPTPPVGAAPTPTVAGFFAAFDFVDDEPTPAPAAAAPSPAPSTNPPPTAKVVAASPAPTATPAPEHSAKPPIDVGTVTSETVFAQFDWRDEEASNERP